MPSPVTLNEATETVPAVAGSVTPPVDDIVPAGVKTTVPDVELTATLPKFMSVVLAMAMGLTILAVAVADAVICAEVLLEKPITRIGAPKMRIVFFTCFLFEYWLK